MELLRGTEYPLKRHEIEACRTDARAAKRPLPQVLGEWAFCMLMGIRANQGIIKSTAGVVYGVQVHNERDSHLLLPVDGVLQVDKLALVTLHHARYPWLRLGPDSSCGGDYFDVVSPNDGDWVATVWGGLQRVEFLSHAERLDANLFPLGTVYHAQRGKLPMFGGKCAYLLWRRKELKDL